MGHEKAGASCAPALSVFGSAALGPIGQNLGPVHARHAVEEEERCGHRANALHMEYLLRSPFVNLTYPMGSL